MSGQREQRRGAGELERAALAVLWAADEPLTPTQIRAALGDSLAYNTVHTILTRLLEKGLVGRHQHDGRVAYAPVKDAAELAVERMQGALAAGGDRDLVLRRFVTSLSSDDERVLRAMLHPAGPVPGELSD
jgi:predicted transcriptional regulator